MSNTNKSDTMPNTIRLKNLFDDRFDERVLSHWRILQALFSGWSSDTGSSNFPQGANLQSSHRHFAYGECLLWILIWEIMFKHKLDDRYLNKI